MSTGVLVVDDQSMVRAGFSALLGAQPELHIVGEAADGLDAVRAATEHQPDVVLMDIRMPGMDGIAATEQIVATSEARVLVLTTFNLDEYVLQALRAGASGFLLKDARAEELTQAVLTVARGEALLAPAVLQRLLAELVRQPVRPQLPQELDQLTTRESEVLQLIAAGLSNQEIAAHLDLAEQTVKGHVSGVLGKLALRDRAQAVVLAYESGLVQPGGA